MTSVEDSIVYGSIVGVVQDFHFADYKSTIKPFAFVSRQSLLDYATIKIEADNIRNSIDKIERSWLEISGGIPMEYSFLDETFNKLHLQEAKLSKILVALTTLSILVAIIGMYAIARTTIKDRLKEIAIRKVLGSTVLSVSQFIINKFLIIVGLANLIAIPVAIYLSQNWLNGFEYRITPGVGIYGIAVVATLLVAWLTVGYQSLKASLSNPAKVLRQD